MTPVASPRELDTPLSVTVPEHIVTPCFSEDPDVRQDLTTLFGSTDLMDHMDARQLCQRCPFLDGCRQLAHDIASTPASGWARIPEGTWGGQLWRGGKLVAR